MPAATTKRHTARRVRIPTHYPDKGTATVRDAMRFLGIGLTRLYQLIGNDTTPATIPSFKEGTKRLFDWSDLWAYHRARKQSGERTPASGAA